MADNVQANPGAAGATFRTIDDGSAQWPAALASYGSTAGTVTIVDGTHGLPANIITSVLPTGAATSAKQDTGNTSLSSIDGKITACNTGAVVISSALPAGANAIGKLAANSGVTIGAVEIAAAQTLATVTTLSTLTGGAVAHDGADSGNPHKVGGRAVSAEIAAVSNNDRTDFVADLVGKQIVMPYANPENFVSGAITSAMTGTTSTSLIGAPASGLRNYITQITVSNSHATVGTDILIQDGSGGTTLYVIPAAPAFGGATLTFPVPLRQPTTATAIYCQNVTTGSNTKVSASGYKGA